jgi:Na+/proline symporter
MIGASLSGVSFMSVPGNVYNENFYYVPMLIGFLFGYGIIALVLLPLYFRMNLTSIYSYLEGRFGTYSYKTGAVFFIVSRLLGAAVRTFLVIFVLYNFVLKDMNVPFWVAAVLFVLLAIFYTMKGGVKTIIWTDTLQTTFMIVAVFLSVYFICKELGWGVIDLFSNVKESSYSTVLDTNIESSSNWIKRFLSGVLVPIAMTGLDQAMMQKSLSCKNVKEAQKNVMTSVIMMLPINILFLSLGAVLAIYLQQHQELLPELIGKFGKVEADKIFPSIAFSLKPVVGIVFFIGLISAAYPTCANALTSLTTSTCIDIVGFEKRDWSEDKKSKIRWGITSIIALLFVILIIAFNILKNDAVINLVYGIAAYTYGPLLGLFMFGIITKVKTLDKAVPFVCLAAPLICFLIEQYIFSFGFSLIAVCALITFVGLFVFKGNK